MSNIYIKVEIGTFQGLFVAAITDAPEAYDGFGTFTLETINDEADESSKIFRLVLIRTEHLQWQTGRYSSGLYSCDHEAADRLTDQEQITNIILKKVGFLS